MLGGDTAIDTIPAIEVDLDPTVKRFFQKIRAVEKGTNAICSMIACVVIRPPMAASAAAAQSLCRHVERPWPPAEAKKTHLEIE